MAQFWPDYGVQEAGYTFTTRLTARERMTYAHYYRQ